MQQVSARTQMVGFPWLEAAIFVLGSKLVAGVVYLGIPKLTEMGIDTVAAWMGLAMLYVFVPIIACAGWLLFSEGSRQNWEVRLRLARPSAQDWVWGAAGLLGIVVLSGVMFGVCRVLGLEATPPFYQNAQPWTGTHAWLFALWLVYWPINILGEEFVWRGVILPRMETALGGTAWLLNAVLWGVFHLAFGWGNLLVLLPTLFITPYIVQRRRNTWLGVLLHAGISLPGFAALAFGLM